MKNVFIINYDEIEKIMFSLNHAKDVMQHILNDDYPMQYLVSALNDIDELLDMINV